MRARITSNTVVEAALKIKTVFHDIEGALNKLILLSAGSTPIAWEGIKFDPVLGTAYLQVFHVPALSFAASLGYAGWTGHRGVTQINVVVPADRGTAEALSLADLLTHNIRRGVVTPLSDGAAVRILSLSLGMATMTKAWAILPVSITWQCYTPEGS